MPVTHWIGCNSRPVPGRSPRGAASYRVKQRGAASLVVVLMLFFVIALVSAYTSRNLIFEQRTSVNQYRSSMAFEAAEAGMEWATAMLNGGRMGDDCSEATAAAGSTSFRQRTSVLMPAPESSSRASRSSLLAECWHLPASGRVLPGSAIALLTPTLSWPTPRRRGCTLHFVYFS